MSLCKTTVWKKVKENMTIIMFCQPKKARTKRLVFINKQVFLRKITGQIPPGSSVANNYLIRSNLMFFNRKASLKGHYTSTPHFASLFFR
jgi:hypothetical protein